MSAAQPATFDQEGPEGWSRSEKYHNDFLIANDPVLDKVVAHSQENDLDDIAVSPAQGKFNYLLAKSISAKRVLEVGTLGAYSTIWFARALPDDGEVVSLELDEKHVKVSRENAEQAGFGQKIKVIQGSAVDTIKALPTEQQFDLAFIDADKENNLIYFTEAKRLVRSGGVIIVDNVGRRGKVANPANNESGVLGVRRLLDAIKTDLEVEATSVHTVGEKGFDGFLYAFRK